MFRTSFGVLFQKSFFSPVFHGGSCLRNVFKKSKKLQNFQKCRKSFPKVSKRVLNKFWGYFFQKFFLPIVPWRVEFSKCFQKVFKNSKMPKIVPKSVQLCFEHVLGVLFSKNFFCPVFHGGSRLRNVFKKSKKFQISKKAQNRSQKCPNVFWTCFGVFFSKSFFAQCSMEGRVLEMFSKKLKNFQTFKNAQNPSQNVQTCFEHVLRYSFQNFFFAQFSMEGRVFEMFSKNRKYFKISKNAQNRSQKRPNVFWTCFGVRFLKTFLPSVPWRVESSKCFCKKINNFKSSKNAQNCS